MEDVKRSVSVVSEACREVTESRGLPIILGNLLEAIKAINRGNLKGQPRLRDWGNCGDPICG